MLVQENPTADKYKFPLPSSEIVSRSPQEKIYNTAETNLAITKIGKHLITKSDGCAFKTPYLALLAQKETIHIALGL